MADIQYADKDTRGRRHYRGALEKLEECVADLNKRNPTFVVQLGDIVDGYLGNVEKSAEDLDSVLRVFNRLKMPKYHVIGNHCMYAGRKNLRKKLGLKRFYYDFTVPTARGWRFVVLDGNDPGYGVMGEKQIEWLRSTLAKAAKNGERVVCLCHFPLLRRANDGLRLLKPRSLVKTVDDAGCVVAWFAGHLHAGGYVLHNGVHHVTFKGMVQSPVKNAYALVELYPNRIRIIGFGKEPSRDLPLQTPQSKSNQPAGALAAPAGR